MRENRPITTREGVAAQAQRLKEIQRRSAKAHGGGGKASDTGPNRARNKATGGKKSPVGLSTSSSPAPRAPKQESTDEVRTSKVPFKGSCNYCHKQGHKEAECRFKQRKQEEKSSGPGRTDSDKNRVQYGKN